MALRVRCVARRSPTPSTARPSPRRSSRAPAPRPRTSPSPIIAGFSGGVPGNEVLTYNAGQGQAAVGPGRRHVQVERHLHARLQRGRLAPGVGRRGAATASRTRWASRRRASRTRRSPRSARTSPPAPSRAPSAAAGRPTTPACTTSSSRCTTPKASSNDGDYSNPALDKLIDEAASAKSLDESEQAAERGADHPVQGPAGHPALVLERDRWLQPERVRRRRSAGTPSRCTTPIYKK